MKKLIVLCWIPLCLFLFTTCKKDNTFKVTLSGNVFAPNQNQGVANATVVLSASLITSGTYNSNYNQVGLTTTDGSGNYSFATSIDGKPVGIPLKYRCQRVVWVNWGQKTAEIFFPARANLPPSYQIQNRIWMAD